MQTLTRMSKTTGRADIASFLGRRLLLNIDFTHRRGPTERRSRAMTIVAHTDEQGAHRLEASLEKLVDVLLAKNISERSVLERDLALIKGRRRSTVSPASMELIQSSSVAAW